MKKQTYSKDTKKITERYHNLERRNFQDIDMMFEDQENLPALKEISLKTLNGDKEQNLKLMAISAIGLIGGHTPTKNTAIKCLQFLIDLEKRATIDEDLRSIKNAIIHILEHLIRDNKLDTNLKLPPKYQKILESTKFKIIKETKNNPNF